MTIFVPTLGGSISVSLPGELLRAKVTRVVNRDTCIVEIGQPMARTHSFRLGDLVACRRTAGVLGETWQAIEQRASSLPDLPPAKPDAAKARQPAKTKAKPAKAKRA